MWSGPPNDSQITFDVKTNDFVSVERILRQNNVSEDDVGTLKIALQDDTPPTSPGRFGPKSIRLDIGYGAEGVRGYVGDSGRSGGETACGGYFTVLRASMKITVAALENTGRGGGSGRQIA